MNSSSLGREDDTKNTVSDPWIARVLEEKMTLRIPVKELEHLRGRLEEKMTLRIPVKELEHLRGWLVDSAEYRPVCFSQLIYQSHHIFWCEQLCFRFHLKGFIILSCPINNFALIRSDFLSIVWWSFSVSMNHVTSLTEELSWPAMKESSPEVGSSMKRRGGSIISSVPTDSLFLSPPAMSVVSLRSSYYSRQIQEALSEAKFCNTGYDVLCPSKPDHPSFPKIHLKCRESSH